MTLIEVLGYFALGYFGSALVMFILRTIRDNTDD